MDPSLQLKVLMFTIWMFFLIFSVKKFTLGRASQNWLRVVANVQSSKIEAKKSGDNGLTFYSPVIVYSYSLNNKNYTGSNFTFLGTSGLTKEYAEKHIRKYGVGSNIEIYYNPKVPDMSVIIPGIHWKQYASILLITLMFLGFGNIIEILNLIWPSCEPNCT